MNNIDEKIEKVEEKIENINFATEILAQMKDTIKRQWILIVILIGALFVSNMVWLYVFNQYEYSTTIDATGIYTAVDQSGNIITQDVTEEQWKLFMEWMNGNSQSDQN